MNFVFINKENKEKTYFANNISNLKIAYKGSIQKYKFLSENIFQEKINQDDVLELFYKGGKAKGNEKRYYRGLLYKKLYHQYEILKSFNILQLHFHLKNSESFLRFHKPSRSGDNLYKSRNSVNLANEQRKSYSGFETGRVVSGFRNVFPIKYKNEHIGSVEISLSSKAIIKSLSNLDALREYTIVVNKEKIDAKIFKIQKHLYKEFNVNKNYLLENTNDFLANSHIELSKRAKEINEKLIYNEELQKALKRGESIGTYTSLDNDFYEITFLPLKGLDSQIEGYLISYKKNNDLPSIIKNYPLYPITILGIGFIFIVLSLTIRQKSINSYNQKKWFNTITETVGDGLYVIDNKATIEYANPMASKILGFSNEEFIGANSHYLFHSHYINDHLPQEECPILQNIIQKKEYYSNEEFFTCKDGTTIPVDLSATPIIEDNQITKIVVIFKDISEQKKIESNMRMLTKALESTKNAIVITDINAHIKWANPSFEQLTGFSLHDVLSKTPQKLIHSGKQSQEFYKEMWKTILNKKPWTGELINKKKDGSLYYEELTITPVLNNDDKIENFIAVKQDITERKAMEDSIKHSAFYDALTNLPNRRLLINHLEQIFTTFTLREKNVAILFLDIDKFKPLNDTHGHDKGDELLVQISQRLSENIRKEDLVARLGGDEFIVILDNLPKEIEKTTSIVKLIAEKIRMSIKEPFDLKDITYNTSTSIGVYIFNDTQNDIDTILKYADTALYKAKNQGRDSICFY